MDKIMAEIISDLFINLASGWIGASVILPVTSKIPKKFNFVVLTINLVIATVLLIAVYFLKKLYV